MRAATLFIVGAVLLWIVITGRAQRVLDALR